MESRTNMKMNELESGQGFAATIVGVFVAVLIGTVLLGPTITSINQAKGVGLSASSNTTVDNVPLLFSVLLLVGVLGAMITVIR